MIEAAAPPNAVDSEAAFLGSIFLEPELLDDFGDLKPDQFYDSRCGIVFATIRAMHSDGVPIDAVTVTQRLNSDGTLAEVGQSRLIEIAESVPHPAHARAYADSIHETAKVRAIIALCRRVVADGMEGQTEAEALIGMVETGIQEMDSQQPDDGVRTAAECIDEANAPEESRPVFPTGLTDLDRQLKGGGFQGGQLIVMGARPSVGKTALGCQVVCHNALAGTQGLIIQMEMSQREIGERMQAAGFGGAPAKRVRVVNETDLTRISSHIRKAVRNGCQLVFVDYLQLITGTGGNRQQNREQEVAKAARTLKALTTELGICIILASQLNRDSDKSNRQPVLSDLRESGAIEQDANTVILMYHADPDDQTAIGLDLAKQRSGSRDRSIVTFDGPRYTFSDRTQQHAYHQGFDGGL